MVHYKPIVVLSQERDGMHGQKIGLPRGRKTASLKFGLLDYFFFIFTNGGCTCFYEEKTKIIARATRANHKTQLDTLPILHRTALSVLNYKDNGS